MNYKANVTLKKADTEGHVPTLTLQDFVHSELIAQLGKALRPNLIVNRSDQPGRTDQVAFSTELVVLQADQWQTLKDALTQLPVDQQQAVWQLIAQIDRS